MTALPQWQHRAVSDRHGVSASFGIEMPSGFLAHGNPASWMFGVAVIEMSVPTGGYAIEVIKDDESGRIAAARLVLNSGVKASTWGYATRWQKRSLPKNEHRSHVSSIADHSIDRHPQTPEDSNCVST